MKPTSFDDYKMIYLYRDNCDVNRGEAINIKNKLSKEAQEFIKQGEEKGLLSLSEIDRFVREEIVCEENLGTFLDEIVKKGIKIEKDIVFEFSKDYDKYMMYNPENPVNIYIGEVRKVPELTSEDEKLLINRLDRDVDGKVKRILAEAYIILVLKIAYEYMCRSLSVLDLIFFGIKGLTNGVENYDPTSAYPLAIYLSWWIRNIIEKTLRDTHVDILIPTEKRVRYNMVKSKYVELFNTGEEKPKAEDVAKQLDYPIEEVEKIIQELF